MGLIRYLWVHSDGKTMEESHEETGTEKETCLIGELSPNKETYVAGHVLRRRTLSSGETAYVEFVDGKVHPLLEGLL